MNNFVEFLACYGPVPAQDNLYDENIRREQRRLKVQPLIAAPPLVEALISELKGADPPNVVLTGTAGDGKTFHCRLMYEQLGGDMSVWEEGKKVCTLPLPHGKELSIVKDLSELTSAEKDQLVARVYSSFSDQNNSTRFLIAANDGHLLATWAARAAISQEASRVHEEFESLLLEQRSRSEQYNLHLYNLTTQEGGELFSRLLDAVVEHPDWKICSECPNSVGNGCAISRNRNRLRDSTQFGFRRRLTELVNLSSANDKHIPARQLLVLISNVLLGHKGVPQILTCTNIVKDVIKPEHTNPYDLAFGYNLEDARRKQFGVFAALESFSVGKETYNEVDNLLVFGTYDNELLFGKLVENDKEFGGSLYADLREDYVEGDRENLDAFLSALESQRRRLFFELPDDSEMSPWRLNVYHYASHYLQLRSWLLEGNRRAAHEIVQTLVQGLNRTLTGLMIGTERDVLFCSSGGEGGFRIAKYLELQLPVNRSRTSLHYIQFDFRKGHKHLRLSVVEGGSPIVSLELRLPHFEVLMRASEGYLPTSFSRQCFEDFRDFQTRVIGRLNSQEKLLDEDDDNYEDTADLISFRVLTVTDDGEFVPKKYELRGVAE